MKSVRGRLIGTLLIVGSAWPGAEVLADTIFLRNGRRIQGQIVTQNRILVIVNTGGLRRQIRKNRIARIRYDSITKSAAKPRRHRARTRPFARKPVPRKTVRKKNRPAAATSPRKQTGNTAASPWLPWRSAFVPGWDRFQSGRKLTGALWLGGFFAGAGLTVNARNNYARRRDAAEAENNIWSALSLGGDTTIITLNILNRRARFAALEKNQNELRGAGILLGLIYLFNLADAWFFADAPPGKLASIAEPPRTMHFSFAQGSSETGRAGANMYFEIRLPLGATR